MKTYTAKERELAARICSANASAGTRFLWWPSEFFQVTSRVRDLFAAAWWHARLDFPRRANWDGALCWADAESLIRTGWTP